MTTTEIVECIKKNEVVVVIDNELQLTSGIRWDDLYNMVDEYNNKLALTCQENIKKRFEERKVITQAEYDKVIADSKLGFKHVSKNEIDECLQANGISVSPNITMKEWNDLVDTAESWRKVAIKCKPSLA
jgi:hypothetical protein